MVNAAFFVDCVHNEGTNGQDSYCPKCVEAAMNRLYAIAYGSVAISLIETLPARGLTAMWLDKNGRVQSDTFKVYSRGEVETVLAATEACEPRLAHPLFVAQDPNFLWPLITYHGTVRAALEYVAPHIDWNLRLGVPSAIGERNGIVQDAGPGKVLYRCSNGLCTKLKPHATGGVTKFCDGCNARP